MGHRRESELLGSAPSPAALWFSILPYVPFLASGARDTAHTKHNPTPPHMRKRQSPDCAPPHPGYSGPGSARDRNIATPQ
jgi:hypothetical protein